jgi:hypothetical protein
MKQHTATIDIDDGTLGIIIKCPYDLTDESRPCWPTDEDGAKDPAPQPFCNWSDWCDNLSPDEQFYGCWRLEGVPVDLDEWDEGPHFILGHTKCQCCSGKGRGPHVGDGSDLQRLMPNEQCSCCDGTGRLR